MWCKTMQMPQMMYRPTFCEFCGAGENRWIPPRRNYKQGYQGTRGQMITRMALVSASPHNKYLPTTALQGKSHLCITFLGIARHQSQFHIHVSVSGLCIPRIGPHISLQQNRQTDPRSI